MSSCLTGLISSCLQCRIIRNLVNEHDLSSMLLVTQTSVSSFSCIYTTTQFRITGKLYRGQKRHFLKQETSIPTDGHYRVTARHYGVLIQACNECNHIL
jgi:hypothetical protein